MTYQLGDSVTLTVTAPADATVVLNVTAPNGTESTPATSNVTTTWSASFTANQRGQWLYAWVVSGSASNVEIGAVQVDAPWYATLTRLKSALTVESTATDEDLSDGLATASRAIDSHCGRRFYKDSAATSYLLYADQDRKSRIEVPDFWTTDGLVLELDSGGDGTFETTWVAADYELQPLNGIVDGEEGWPYHRIKAVRQCWPSQCDRASVRLTAKWGWTAVPAPVKSACLILAAETVKLTREAPFGVADFGSGLIRLRENSRVMTMLQPYRRDPVRVG